MAAGRHRQRQMAGRPRLALRVTGAGLLAAWAGIHLDLYLTGYRSVPTIGWLFLLQVIAGVAPAAAVLATRSRLAAAAGAAAEPFGSAARSWQESCLPPSRRQPRTCGDLCLVRNFSTTEGSGK